VTGDKLRASWGQHDSADRAFTFCIGTHVEVDGIRLTFPTVATGNASLSDAQKKWVADYARLAAEIVDAINKGES